MLIIITGTSEINSLSLTEKACYINIEFSLIKRGKTTEKELK